MDGTANTSWADTDMHQNVLWFGNLQPQSLGPELLAVVLNSCDGSLARCFFKSSADNSHHPGRQIHQRLWFHSPVTVTEIQPSHWLSLRRLARTTIISPVFWNGQDTNNIYHVLVSFLGRLWLHLHEHFPDALGPSSAAGIPRDAVIYVFDLHPRRPHMFGQDGSPLVPGSWATEFARHAFPGVKIVHAGALAGQAPVLFRRLHFNLVNWSSWVLPSEDLYPPRISRGRAGPHALLASMPGEVKRGLGVDEAEGDRAVLLLRRSAPAGRRLTNDRALAEALLGRGLAVRVADPSVMLFAAQVEAVAHAAVLVGAHGQGLFNLVFLPAGGGVVEVPPCGVALALVYNVAELFGFAFTEILDTSCDEEFFGKLQESGMPTMHYPRGGHSWRRGWH